MTTEEQKDWMQFMLGRITVMAESFERVPEEETLLLDLTREEVAALKAALELALER